jgi:hypothetical protein
MQMSEAGSLRGSPDDQEINVDDSDELRHWSSLFKARPESVIEAVARVGKSPARVRALLQEESNSRG